MSRGGNDGDHWTTRRTGVFGMLDAQLAICHHVHDVRMVDFRKLWLADNVVLYSPVVPSYGAFGQSIRWPGGLLHHVAFGQNARLQNMPLLAPRV